VSAGTATEPADRARWFVTRTRLRTVNGDLAAWESRVHRKHLAGHRSPPGTWWAPTARGWWIGVLFAVGSILFALGTVPPYAHAVGLEADAVTFFVGSLFFTAAGFLTYREAVDAGAADGRPRRRFLVVQPHRIDWWASGVQLVGTLFFNVSTAHAMVTDLSATAARHQVWRPDALGSICFLVASALAWREVCHAWWGWSPRTWGWWIAGLNLVGSLAFGVSAVAAFVVPSTGLTWNVELSNLGTFVGAVCFLVGAVFLLPERTDQRGVAEARAAVATGRVPGLAPAGSPS
jgi:hypothetical protein